MTWFWHVSPQFFIHYMTVMFNWLKAHKSWKRYPGCWNNLLSVPQCRAVQILPTALGYSVGRGELLHRAVM